MGDPVVEPVDPFSGQLAAWHATLRSAYLAGQEVLPWETLRLFTWSMHHPNPRRRRELYAVLDEGELVGASEFTYSLVESAAPAELEIGVRADRRRQGVGTLLMRHALKRAAALGRDVLQASFVAAPDVPPGHVPGGNLLERFGFVVGNVEARLVLDLPYAGPTDVPAGDVVIRTWTGACPQDCVAQWAALRQQMNEDVPVGTLTRPNPAYDVAKVRSHEHRMGELGWILVRSMAIRAGTSVGYTELLVDREDPEIVQQEDTLVDRSHRGHGVGAALKAANLTALAGLEPNVMRGMRHVHTWTAPDNAPMQALNARLGFRRVGTTYDAELHLQP